jgi:hypothetical protein
MADKNRQQKRMSEPELRVRNTSFISSADLLKQVSSKPPFSGVGDANVNLIERITAVTPNSISQDSYRMTRSRKRASEDDSEDHNLPKKKRKSVAAKVLAKVVQTVYEGSAVAFTTYQNYKDKLRNQITYRTSWQAESNSRKMRGHGIDFLHFSDSLKALQTKDLSCNNKFDNGLIKGKLNSQDLSSTFSNENKTSAATATAIDSENWYWVTRDLRVTVIVSKRYYTLYPTFTRKMDLIHAMS